MRSVKSQRWLYIGSDYGAALVAFVAFNAVRIRMPLLTMAEHPPQLLLTYFKYPIVLLETFLFPALMVGLYTLTGFYADVFHKSRVQVVANTIGCCLLGSLLFFLAAMLDDMRPSRSLAYETIGILALLLTAITLIERLVISGVTARRIHRRQWGSNTLIVGTSSKARRMHGRLDGMKKSMGFLIRGYLNPDSNSNGTKGISLPVESLDDFLDGKSRFHDINSLIVMPDSGKIEDALPIVNRLFGRGLNILISTELYPPGIAQPRFGNIVGEPLVNLSVPPLHPGLMNCKRLVDIVSSAIALVLLSPVMLVIGTIVKIDSPRDPVLFRQERLGLHKRPFRIWKFRTMRTDAETGGPLLSSENDSRVTRPGRWLRKYRLDELPNFWNVLRGDMSLIGPRPEREYYERQIMAQAPVYALIHSVRPGITSWGMVKYGYATTVEQMIERMRYDLLYVNNMSPGVDVKILFYTISTIITGKGV